MKNFKKILIKKPLIVYKRNKNFHQIIKSILKCKIEHKNNENNKQSEKYSSCVLRLNNLCCKQVKQTNIFKNYRRNQVFQFFYDLTCKT